MIIINIILAISSIGVILLIAALYGKVFKMQVEFEKAEERDNARFEDLNKKIRIISNKKW